jgi:hypothetical protein
LIIGGEDAHDGMDRVGAYLLKDSGDLRLKSGRKEGGILSKEGQGKKVQAQYSRLFGILQYTKNSR